MAKNKSKKRQNDTEFAAETNVSANENKKASKNIDQYVKCDNE